MAIRSSLVAMVALSCLCLIGSLVAGTEAMGTMPGGLKDVSNFANSVEIDDLANFAVDQYKSRQVCCNEVHYMPKWVMVSLIVF